MSGSCRVSDACGGCRPGTPVSASATLALDLLDAADAADAPVDRRSGLARLGPALVVRHQRPRLAGVDGQALLHGLLEVVDALDQLVAGRVVPALDLRRG